MFNITTMKDNECIPRKGGGTSKSIVTDLIDIQTRLRKELDKMSAMVVHKDAEISALKASVVAESFKVTSSLEKLNAENAELHEKVKKLEAKVEVLTAKVEDLTQQIMKAHAIQCERMILLLRQLSQAPSGPFS